MFRFVDQARDSVQREYVLDILRNATVGKRTAVVALALADLEAPKTLNGDVPFTVVYDIYAFISNEAAIDVRSESTVRGYLDEFETASLLTSETKQHGRSVGTHKHCSLSRDPEIIVGAIRQSSDEIDELFETVGMETLSTYCRNAFEASVFS